MVHEHCAAIGTGDLVLMKVEFDRASYLTRLAQLVLTAGESHNIVLSPPAESGP